MTTVQRPNKDALSKGCDIYLDAMRPFLLRGLRRVKGSNLQDAIRRSLPDRQRSFFDASLSRNSDVAGAIDIGMFPHLVRAYWRVVFFDEFGRNNFVRDQVWLIRDARNKVAHPGTTDLDDNYARSRLSDIAYVLGSINAPAEKKAVESIRDSLWRRYPTRQIADNPPSPSPVASNDTGQRVTPALSDIRSKRQANDGVARPAVDTGTLQQYVIYVDDPTNRSRIHNIDCRWYVNRKAETLSDNYWLYGPYTLEEATETERDVGKKDSGFCGTCIR